MEKQTVVNSTETNDSFTNGSKTSSEEAARSDDMDGETISKEIHEDEEVIGNIENNGHDDI